jgi:hypothetical protein
MKAGEFHRLNNFCNRSFFGFILRLAESSWGRVVAVWKRLESRFVPPAGTPYAAPGRDAAVALVA